MNLIAAVGGTLFVVALTPVVQSLGWLSRDAALAFNLIWWLSACGMVRLFVVVERTNEKASAASSVEIELLPAAAGLFFAFASLVGLVSCFLAVLICVFFGYTWAVRPSLMLMAACAGLMLFSVCVSLCYLWILRKGSEQTSDAIARLVRRTNSGVQASLHPHIVR